MAEPATTTEYLELVRQSGVLEPQAVEDYVNQRRLDAALPARPGELAEDMVQAGLLTSYQAEQFLLGNPHLMIAGKYKLLEHLGTGGMGTVYLAEHKHMRRQVAIKVLRGAQTEGQGVLERFYREARAIAHLHHPNIVGAHDIDHDGKLHFIVMEYVDGNNLQHIVRTHGPMDVTRACHYVAQAALGLQYVHEAGLVHRDIKPANLLVERSGTVKILDLGLARFFRDKDDNLTKEFDAGVLGTADYLAPEQVLDSHNADIRADIYGLGITFYFLLTGRGPFGDGSVAQKMIWHQVRQPRPIRELREEIPEEVAAVIDKMLAKDPANRHQTPIEVVKALAPWTQQPIEAPPEEEMGRTRVEAATTREAESTPSSGVTGTRERAAGTLTMGPPAASGIGAAHSGQTHFQPLPPARFPRWKVAGLAAAGAGLLLAAGAGIWWAAVRGVRPPGPTSPTTQQVSETPEPITWGPAAQGDDLVWSAYDSSGTLIKDRVAIGPSPTFTVPAGNAIFVTTSFDPIDLSSADSALRMNFDFSASAGLTDATERCLGFGIYHANKASHSLADAIGYLVLWNPGGYFESYVRNGRGDLFFGKQLAQGGTKTGALVDKAIYHAQVQLRMNSSATGISLGRSTNDDTAGIAVAGPHGTLSAWTDPVIPLLGGEKTFNEFAIKFQNTSANEVTFSVKDFKVLTGRLKE